MSKLIPTLHADPGPNGYSIRDKECLEAQVATIRRFLGESSNTGIEQAIRLADSKEPAPRLFAARILAQIGTREARKHLEILAKDSDSDVASLAKFAATATKPLPIAPDSFRRVRRGFRS